MDDDPLRALARRRLEESRDAHDRLVAEAPGLARIAVVLAGVLEGAGRILLFGNGGSAADAQHFAAELVGRFLRDRDPLPAVALTTNASTVTAVANDYGYEQVFARQVAALGRPGDAVWGLSTSGRSPNVLAAMREAQRRGLVRVGFAGAAGGPLADLVDHCFRAPADATPRIQECHLAAGHVVCELIEVSLFGDGSD